jgi:hypothetical protein
LLNFIFIEITHNFKKLNIRPKSQVTINTYTFQRNQPTRCNNFSSLLLDVYMQLMEKISWTDHVRNEEVLLRVKEQRNILHEIRKRKANWIGHILLRNCLLQRVIEEKIKGGIEVTERQERRRGKLLDDLKKRRGYSHLKEEALHRTMWRARFGRGFGPVVRQTAK